jgi:ribosomal protein S6
LSEKSHNYELAYHLNPRIEDSRSTELKQYLEDQITSRGGMIVYSKLPERIRLAYEIDHQNQGFFGYVQFTFPNGELLAELNDVLRHNNELLRFMIIKLPAEMQKGQSALKQLKAKERAERKAKAAQITKPTTEKEEKEIEKQLEDIIEKL